MMSPIQEESHDHRHQLIPSTLKSLKLPLKPLHPYAPSSTTDSNSGAQQSEKTRGMEGGLSSNQETLLPPKPNRNKEALQALNLQNVTRSLILRQIREFNYVQVDLSLMSLLKYCLESPHRGRSSVVALSGYIEHFESRMDEDLGWGCGWRNIQMLSSYIIAQSAEYKDTLFGGAGFVPDIPALQQWLEIAWLKGFDVLGAEYFDWKISGTHKWIGTTECAALLRSFGVRARVVDFRTALTSKRESTTIDSIGTKAGGSKGGGGSTNLDQPGDDDDTTEEISGNFNQMTISHSHSPRPATTQSEHNSRSPSSPVIVLPDQKEELHILRLRPDDPNSCLICVEERKHNISATQLHAHLDDDDHDDVAEAISGNFNQMTISHGHSPRRTTTQSDQTTDRSSSPSSHVIVLPDQNEELHFLRPSPDDPNICLSCVEERKHNISASQLHALTREEQFVHSGDSSVITGAQRHANSSAGGGGGGGGGAHPADVPLNHKYMMDWIWNYFSGDSERPSNAGSNFSLRSPLYFQHRGHSRTIVGIERCKKDGSNKEEDYLIVLDPSQRTRDIVAALQGKQDWEGLVKRGMHTLNQAEYQLCYIDPGIAEGEELESLKTLSSLRYMY